MWHFKCWAGNVIGGGIGQNIRLIPDTIRSSIKNKTVILRNPNFNDPKVCFRTFKGYLILHPLKYSSAWNLEISLNQSPL